MEAQETKYNQWLLVIIAILVAILLFTYRSCESNLSKVEEQENLIKSMEDTLKVWIDKDGNHRAKISVLETSKLEDFLKIQTKDKEITRLQELAKKNREYLKKGGSISTIATEGTYTYKGDKPKITFNKDRIADFNYNPCDTVYPIYEKDFLSKGKWIWGTMRMGPNETELQLQYRDSLDIVLGRDKTGFLGLGKGRPFGDVTSHSPYTVIKQYRVYNVTDGTPPKRFGLGGVAGYGFGTASLKPQFFVGIGGSYNFVKF